MKFIFVIVFLLEGFYVMSQTGKKIIYVLPDSVEVLISEHINSDNKRNSNFFCFLQKRSEYNIVTIISYKRDRKLLTDWVVNSNRYVIINNRYLPVLIDYDFEFGTIQPDSIGAFGSRDDGYVKRMKFIAHDYSITFKRDGSVVKVEKW